VSRSRDDIPPELREIDARMRGLRSEWSAIELDRIKRRAMERSRAERTSLRARFARSAVALAIAASVGIGGVAVATGDHDGTRPGKGCGDRHHYHEKRGECHHHHHDDGDDDD
jgi:hypothetical protein